jgi:glycosyltransferase involved in cell wall biosynthesis
MSVRLNVVGDGRDRGVFEKQVADQGLPPDTVVFRGFLEHGEALRAVSQAHVGIIPHHTNESCQTTIPNKLFDYMAAGLAVVSSDCIPIKRILEETGCGVTFEDRSSASFVQAMKSVIDPRARRNMAEAGQRWIHTKYCWEQDGERLLKCLTQVGERAPW